MVLLFLLRITSTGISTPTLVLPTIGGRLAELTTLLLSNDTITSPTSIPAACAGLSGRTLATSAPRGCFMPNDSARSSVTSWISTPSQPRETRPLVLSWSATSMATSIGIANDRPM